MANYYIQFCETINDLTDAEILWVKECFSYEPPEELPSEYPGWYDADAESIGFDHSINMKARSLSLFSDTDGNIDTLEAFVRAFITKFRPDYIFSISWAETCDKSRNGAFGGGALVITKDKTESMATWQFIRDTVARLAAERVS